MNSFESFWEENKENYIDLAKADFSLLQSKFNAYVEVDSDDDFTLDIEHSFKLNAETREVLIDRLIEKLNSAKFEYVKTWSVTDNNNVKTNGTYADSWLTIRDNAIKELKKGNLNISYGGNQSIEIQIFENKPSYKNNKFK